MMTVKILETGEVAELEDSWGLRLVEQGKAVPAEPVKRKKVRNGTERQDRG